MESLCVRALWQTHTVRDTCITPCCASLCSAGCQEPVFAQTSPDVALGETGAKGALAGRGSAKWKWVGSQGNG